MEGRLTVESRVRVANPAVRRYYGRTGTIKDTRGELIEVQLDGDTWVTGFWVEELWPVKALVEVSSPLAKKPKMLDSGDAS